MHKLWTPCAVCIQDEKGYVPPSLLAQLFHFCCDLKPIQIFSPYRHAFLHEPALPCSTSSRVSASLPVPSSSFWTDDLAAFTLDLSPFLVWRTLLKPVGIASVNVTIQQDACCSDRVRSTDSGGLCHEMHAANLQPLSENGAATICGDTSRWERVCRRYFLTFLMYFVL